MTTDNQEFLRSLRRIETKLVLFAEAMGVHTEADPDWLTVDDDARIIYVSTTARSYVVMHATALARGATKRGKFYDIIHKGDVIGTLYL